MKDGTMKTIINFIALGIFFYGVSTGMNQMSLLLNGDTPKIVSKKTLSLSVDGNTQTFDILSYHEDEYGMLKIKTKEGSYLYIDKQNVLIKEEITTEKNKEEKQEDMFYNALLSAICLVGGFLILVFVNWYDTAWATPKQKETKGKMIYDERRKN